MTPASKTTKATAPSAPTTPNEAPVMEPGPELPVSTNEAPKETPEAQVEETPEAPKEYVEWHANNEAARYFTAERVIAPKEAKEAWGVEIPEPLIWRKPTRNPRRGRMLLEKKNIPAEALENLLEDPAFTVVTE